MAQEKKVILFVVEGPSDETAMALIFEKLYVNERVFFDVVHTDLTTLALHDRSKSNKGVLELLREDVLEHIRKEPYQWTDLEKVIVIVDTDGAFIASENVIEIPGVEISYSLDHIEASNADSICRRNEHKSRELRVLSSKPFLTYKRHQVELRTYYLSRNMEHVFHDEVGSLSDREKERLARQFQQQYANDIEGFKTFISHPDIAVSGDYKETWQHIACENNSLKRSSNLHLALPK